MSIQGGVVEAFYPGDRLTFTAGGTIAGGDMVEVTGTDWSVTVAGDESTGVVGVALHNAASGEKVTVARQGVYWLMAAGAINAGDQIVCAANGDVKSVAAATTNLAEDINDARAVIGKALEDIGNGTRGRVAIGGGNL